MDVMNKEFLLELKYLEFEDFLTLAQALGVPIYNIKDKKLRKDFENMNIEIIRAFNNLSNSKKRKLVAGLSKDRIKNLIY